MVARWDRKVSDSVDAWGEAGSRGRWYGELEVVAGLSRALLSCGLR